MELGQEGEKRAPEVGVQARHLVRVAYPEAFQRKNAGWSSGLGIRDGRGGSEAARRRYAQRRQPSSTIHIGNSPLFDKLLRRHGGALRRMHRITGGCREDEVEL